MRLDLHIHTSYSADCSVKPENYLKLARKNGLDGFAVTDHNEMKGAAKAFELAKNYNDFVIIRGVEVSSSAGHILGYGVTDPIPRGLSPEETVERIIDYGGVPVAAHPYRLVSGIGPEVVKRVKFDCVEILNHRSMHRENQRAVRLAAELGAGTTGGSDAHYEGELGLAVTEFKINSNREDDILAEISKKDTTPVGKDSTYFEGLKMYTKLVVYWLKRGLRRV
jgi:predicted metal-dependent phosphoesterase TrpH